MQHRPLKRRHSTSSINDHDNPCLKRQKLLASVFKQLQQTAEEVRCALNDATWLSVQERVRAALVIDHVEMMSRMMEEGYEFGDGEVGEDDEEEMEEDRDGGENGEEHAGENSGEDGRGTGDVTEEAAYGDLGNAFVEDASGLLDGEDKNEGSGRGKGGDEDEDGDSGGEETDEDSYSSWIRRGVSFSAGVTCTACIESGGSPGA